MSAIGNCPWCGGEGKAPDILGFFNVQCQQCGASGPISPREEPAITAWNRLATPGQGEVPTDLAALAALAMEATAGPWENCGHERGGCECGAVWSIPADGPVATVTIGEWGDEWPVIDKDADGNPIAVMQKSSYGKVPPALGKANAAYIAAANPAVVLGLIERVQRAEADAARFRWMARRYDPDDYRRRVDDAINADMKGANKT